LRGGGGGGVSVVLYAEQKQPRKLIHILIIVTINENEFVIEVSRYPLLTPLTNYSKQLLEDNV
jgi:hypothetical protein